MPSNARQQSRSERLLAESEAAHAYLNCAIEARNDLIVALNLERAFQSFGVISTGIERGRLDPALENRILAAQQGLLERLYNVACAVVEP
jgi:hypothetical protein